MKKKKLYIIAANMTGFERLRQLESLILENGSANYLLSTADDAMISNHPGKPISIEALLDCLLVLYDECCNSSLRREKTVSDFIDIGKLIF